MLETSIHERTRRGWLDSGPAGQGRRAARLRAAAVLALGLAPTVAPPLASADGTCTGGTTTTCTFGHTGAAQTWTVPAGVSSASFDVFGAQGGQEIERVIALCGEPRLQVMSPITVAAWGRRPVDAPNLSPVIRRSTT